MSHEQEWDYNDLVLGDDVAGQTEAVMDFLSHSAKKWDLIDLRDLRDAGNAITHIESALKRAGLPYRLLREEERCPFMPIDGPWSEILGRRSSATRHTFRNRQSRLNKMTGEGLRVRILDDPHKEPGLLEKMIALEAQKHVGGKPSPPFLGVHSEVFASLFDSLGPKGWLCVAMMELDDRLLAWHLLFRCGGKLWGYLTAYDHDFSHLSPGSMLVPAIVDYGFAHGYTEYDFLSGEEPYKMQWATGFHHTYRLLIWNRRWISRFRAYRNLRVLPSASARDE
ncbi:MAG: GNAT family N-acetyltransferase [Terracidiphilus sp.]